MAEEGLLQSDLNEFGHGCLDSIIEWIAETLTPGQVFDREVIADWLIAEGYTVEEA